MSFYKQYNPYQWPPNIMLAELHSRCSMPGKENPDGEQCPCCFRKTRLRTTNWLFRDIYKDFKNYGGGVLGYFSLLFYYGCALMMVILTVSTFYLYCVHVACTEQALKEYKCVKVFGFFKLMVVSTLLQQLDSLQMHSYAQGLQFFLFLNFLFLLAINFFAHYYLQRVESRLTKRKHILSQFTLFIKNIKKSESLESFKASFKKELPNVHIKEAFFLKKTSDLEQYFNKTIDSYFLLKFYREEKNAKAYAKETEAFISYYERMKELEKKMHQNSGRAVVVFEKVEQKKFFLQQWHMGNMSKFMFNTAKLFKYDTLDNEVYADNMSEPGEMIWTYAGDSSVKKTRVRIKTTAISIIYLVVCFGVMYYPMKLANDQKNPTSIYLINFGISIVLFIMNITYRGFMEKLAVQRRPNTYLSKSNFVVLTTVLFHILFYLYIPAIYYFKVQNTEYGVLKLATLLTQVLIFLIISFIMHSIDMKYCGFSGLRKKLLSRPNLSHQLCQRRLHEKLTYPSFYIEFKLMILYKIWSFVAFYSFQIPQVPVMLALLMGFLYWNDKKNIYTHYKMQSYLPIELESRFQDVYIFVFMITLCLSYMTVTSRDWQRYVAVALTFLVLIIKIVFDDKEKQTQYKEEEVKKDVDLNEAMAEYVPLRVSTVPAIARAIPQHNQQEPLNASKQQQQKRNQQSREITRPLNGATKPAAENKQSETEEAEMPNQTDRPFNGMSKASRSSYLQTTSLKSVSHLSNGYEESYDRYLHQFKSKKIHEMLAWEYAQLTRNSQNTEGIEARGKRQESEMVDIPAPTKVTQQK